METHTHQGQVILEPADDLSDVIAALSAFELRDFEPGSQSESIEAVCCYSCFTCYFCYCYHCYCYLCRYCSE